MSGHWECDRKVNRLETYIDKKESEILELKRLCEDRIQVIGQTALELGEVIAQRDAWKEAALHSLEPSEEGGDVELEGFWTRLQELIVKARQLEVDSEF